MADLTADDRVIADPKVATAFNDTHMARMIGYLNITGLTLTRRRTFKNVKLDCMRVVRRFLHPCHLRHPWLNLPEGATK